MYLRVLRFGLGRAQGEPFDHSGTEALLGRNNLAYGIADLRVLNRVAEVVHRQ